MPKKSPEHKNNLPKVRDPNYRILQSKSGGPMDSESPRYKRQKTSKEGRQQINGALNEAKLNSETNRREAILKTFKAINEWAGEGGLDLSLEGAQTPEQQTPIYLAALERELTDDYYNSDEIIVQQEKRAIQGWVKELQKLKLN